MNITEVINEKEYTEWIIKNSPYDDVYTLIEGDLVDVDGISMGELYTLKRILELEFEEFKEEEQKKIETFPLWVTI